jgi:GNAT superfamily N-acetyltransferase
VPRTGSRPTNRRRLPSRARRVRPRKLRAHAQSELFGAAEVRIDRAHYDEARTVAPLFDAYRQFYRQPSALKKAQNFLATRLRTRESVIFVARTSNRPVGFMQLYPSFSSITLEPTWILNDLFVVPMARRKGVGRLLLKRAQKLALDTGATAILLETASNNPARTLYESLGWKLDREFTHYQWSRR